MRPIAKCLPTSGHGRGFLRQNHLHQTLTKRFYAWHKVFWSHELNRIPEVCLSTSSVNQTIHDFRGDHNTSENLVIIFPHLTRAKHRQFTPKNSRFLPINCRMETFPDSHSRFIQDPGCKPAVEEESPCLQNNF